MKHRETIEEFARLRKQIDAMMGKARSNGWLPSDSAEIDTMIRHLEKLAHDGAEFRVPEPSPPILPPEPKPLPEPPPIPDLPETPGYVAERRRINDEIEHLRAEIDRLTKLGRKTKSLRKGLRKLTDSSKHQLQLLQLRHSPPEIADLYRRLKAEHEKYREKNAAVLSNWRTECAAIRERYRVNKERWTSKLRRSTDLIRIRAVERVKDEWETIKKSNPAVEKVWWSLLPPSENGVVSLERVLVSIRGSRHTARLDEARIHFAYSLRPTRIAIGLHEFDGYIAFMYQHTEKVLLECPFDGNAAYIFNGDWKRLSRLDKSTLLSRHTDAVDRVIHRDGHAWQAAIRSKLR